MAKKRDFFTAFKPAVDGKPTKRTNSDNASSSISKFATSKANTVARGVQDASTSTPNEIEPEEESTDFKLAILSSLHLTISSETLLDFLLSCQGSIEAASTLATTRRKPSTNLIGNQSSLSTFLSSSSSTRIPKKIPYPLPAIPKGKTIHLSTPELVPFHTPCTLQPSFLPTTLATSLLQELLPQSETYARQTFRLFDRNVTSPHSACFYVSDEYAVHAQKNDYLYNGVTLDDIRPFTPMMTKVVGLLEDKVNEEIEKRCREVYPDGKKLKGMLKAGDWKVNTAFVNCYDGGKESVGWHSDQLTYIGPQAVIAAISLGVEREFRLRRVALQTGGKEEQEELLLKKPDKEEESDKGKWAQLEGMASVHVPHNSLLIMHASAQEEWKHSIHPAATVTPHPIAGNKRISITYRCYRESLHPSLTPKCLCGIPTILRSVQRQESSAGRYFWMCHAGNAPDGKNCSFFKWAEFDEDGEPIWESHRVRENDEDK